MPLHDWADDRGWNSLHIVWQNELLELIQQRLPPGYRAYIGSVPALTVDAPNGRPDLNVRTWEGEPGGTEAQTASDPTAPDTETVAVFDLDPQTALHIDLHGQLVAAIEIVSPRNKDRPSARERYASRYLTYVRQGVHLMLIDVLPRPVGFSFADVIAANLAFEQPPCPVPFAVSYRVGESVPGGTLLAVWRRPLAAGQPLAAIPLPLTVEHAITIDLETTYREAARRVYLK
ncbi:Uncharacterized protein OS=Candidatus Entotheonella sp. TSY1 GN=ETSY1_33795 PE=4 SV=1: DUF4058 [Gemmataceae bacterium]|nr:Uncharacterized protein OS=Candidatus Entotheonella sp. TSY1 GN=ETSY1_33795 PE=4 SV=1: DUF4058 [Gemmataceae bacterium]VTT99686.1 Uncharacterized protein OS=Candidatus Entotheonella sp. TSY1 GN=ETSY1_33795 PE=4 SV=1: DUF4058 [Gemmataceae bacterium]